MKTSTRAILLLISAILVGCSDFGTAPESSSQTHVRQNGINVEIPPDPCPSCNGHFIGYGDADCVTTLTDDLDQDGLKDTCEQRLAEFFRPYLVMSSSDPVKGARAVLGGKIRRYARGSTANMTSLPETSSSTADLILVIRPCTSPGENMRTTFQTLNVIPAGRQSWGFLHTVTSVSPTTTNGIITAHTATSEARRTIASIASRVKDFTQVAGAPSASGRLLAILKGGPGCTGPTTSLNME